MAINVKGKSKPAPDASGQEADLSNLGQAAPPPEQSAEDAGGNTPPKGGNVNFAPQQPAGHLMTGTQQGSAVDQIKAIQDLRAKLRGKYREFWLNPGEFARLYFLDGKLLGDNVFDTPMVAIHMLQIGGNWTRFVCNKNVEGDCVICNSNVEGSQPMTVQLFTVINTMPYVIQRGDDKGKTIPARLQLFPATLKVREKLVKRAESRGGTLAGHMFQMSRSQKQDPRTGDDIEYIDSYPMQSVLGKYPNLSPTPDGKQWHGAPTAPIPYAEAYPILTNHELAQLRPDAAHMAGYSAGGGNYNTGPGQAAFAAPQGSLGDDEIPF